MRSDLITPAKILQRATKKLQDRWQLTQETWDDTVRDRFQEKYLDPIVPQMQLALSAVHDLMDVLEQANLATQDEQA